LGELSFKEANPDFAFISSKVFSDPLLLNELNAIIHPAVKEDFKLWLDEKAHQGESWVLKESALLIETKAYEKCHSVILVSSPEEIRIERVMLKRRIQNQIGDDARMPHAEFCINNDGQTALIPQIVNIYKILNSRFGNSHS
jgi:dephospho-CoA kinase